MDNEIVIRFNKVTKTYKLYKNDKKRLLGLIFKNIKCKENKAVNNVSFEVKKGESIALFGKNGAGKSTILKLITEVTYPTSGKIEVNGIVKKRNEYEANHHHHSARPRRNDRVGTGRAHRHGNSEVPLQRLFLP